MASMELNAICDLSSIMQYLEANGIEICYRDFDFPINQDVILEELSKWVFAYGSFDQRFRVEYFCSDNKNRSFFCSSNLQDNNLIIWCSYCSYVY